LDVRRREFIAALGGAAAWPLASRAQQPGRQYRIAELGPSLENPVALTLTNAVRARLRELGFVEGQNVIYHRFLDDPRGPSAVVTELMQWQPDLIFVIGTESALQAVASIPIPIVMVAGDYDPIARGYVKSLAKPGGNITGVVFQQIDLAQKQIELLTQAFPDRNRLGVLYDSGSAGQFASAERVATGLRVRIQPMKLENPPYDFEEAFRKLIAIDTQMVLVLSTSRFLSGVHKLGELGIAHRLPTMFRARFYVDAGGLMSYAVDFTAMFRKTADYAARILKGSKPADLPVELAEKIQFVVNLKTAKLIGIDIPTSILLRADEVIE
jgi:putative tryptophan/tyrosine transport system substrate-binding protein